MRVVAWGLRVPWDKVYGTMVNSLRSDMIPSKAEGFQKEWDGGRNW